MTLAGAGLTWVDLVVIAIIAAYALSGFRQGLVIAACSMAGLVVGAIVAIKLLPLVVGSTAWAAMGTVLRAGLLLVAALVIVNLFQWGGRAVGTRLRQRVRSVGGRRLDAIAGAVLVAFAGAGLLWFLAGFARLSGSTTIASTVGRSVVLARIDQAMPIRVSTLVSESTQLLLGQKFPQVFGGVGAEPIAPVGAPDAALPTSPALAAAGNSVMRIDGDAPGCATHVEGSGWVLAAERVVTNAHVVSGTRNLTVTSTSGRSWPAVVVVFDPARDLAVLLVRGLPAPALVAGQPPARGADVAALGFPLAGPYDVEPARVRERLIARGLDIYGRSDVSREVYSLRAQIRPGNSGGPVVDTDGKVIGVVFARSLDDPQTGYAMTMAEAEPDLTAGRSAQAPVPVGECLRS